MGPHSPSFVRPTCATSPLALLFATVLAAVLSVATAHNWCTVPMTFNRIFPTKRCIGTECWNACPFMLRREKLLNRPDRPAKIWRRGQMVTIAYARNNHHGGFARFSLVPLPLIYSRWAHERFTWFHTCWQAGQYDCKKARHPCGTDFQNRAFRRFARVPKIYPDGDYVLGHVWYGGLHYKEKRGQFPDYYSCSFVRIRGGPFSGRKFTPYFYPGKGEGKGVRRGLCHTSSAAVGKCDRWGCPKQRSFYSKPRAFRGKSRPRPITLKALRYAFKAKTWYRHLLWGTCNYHACCPRRCGAACGRWDCGLKGRKKHECCTGQIRKNKRFCRWVKPPCIRH